MTQRNTNVCAPARRVNNDGASCYTIDELKLMGETLNSYIAMKIMDKRPVVISDDKTHMVKQLTHRLSNICADQFCWLKKVFKNIPKDILNKAYIPSGPEGQFDWLSTINIDRVIKQYMDLYNDFVFLGAVPMDYWDLKYLNIRNLNINTLYNKNKTKIGIVFNTDTSRGTGKHWIGMYADLDKKCIYYYDSTAHKPDVRVTLLVDKLAKWLLNDKNIMANGPYMTERKNNIEKLLDIRWNKKIHQRGDTECGVYAMYFILEMLNGRSFREFCKNGLTDNEINKYRRVYFLHK